MAAKKCAVCGAPLPEGRYRFCSDQCRRKSDYKRAAAYNRENFTSTRVHPAPKRSYHAPASERKDPIDECEHEDCRYRSGKSCLYILVTGEPRGCGFKSCKRYRKRGETE